LYPDVIAVRASGLVSVAEDVDQRGTCSEQDQLGPVADPDSGESRSLLKKEPASFIECQ
jgi:hypothetical protein